MNCKDGCVNVTKEGKPATSRNCWNKVDGEEERCTKNGDEEICYCFTELCNFGEKSKSNDDDGNDESKKDDDDDGDGDDDDGNEESKKVDNDDDDGDDDDDEINESKNDRDDENDKNKNDGISGASKSFFLLISCVTISFVFHL